MDGWDVAALASPTQLSIGNMHVHKNCVWQYLLTKLMNLQTPEGKMYLYSYPLKGVQRSWSSAEQQPWAGGNSVSYSTTLKQGEGYSVSHIWPYSLRETQRNSITFLHCHLWSVTQICKLFPKYVLSWRQTCSEIKCSTQQERDTNID